MEQDKTIVNLVGGALVGVGGWMLGQFSHWYKARKDDNRVRKEAIFYLLDLRHLLALTNMEPVRRIYIRMLREKFEGQGLPENFEELIGAQLDDGLKKLYKPIFDSRFPAVKAGFNTVLGKLSLVDPLVAYQLSGREDALRVTEFFNDYVHGLLSGEQPEGTDVVRNKITMTISSGVHKQNWDAIDDILRQLSRRISIFMYRDVKSTMMKMDKRTEEADPEMKKFLDDYFAAIGL